MIKVNFNKILYENVDSLFINSNFNESKNLLFFGLRKEAEELPNLSYSRLGIWIDNEITFVYSTSFTKESIKYLISTFEQGIVLALNTSLPFDKNVLAKFFFGENNPWWLKIFTPNNGIFLNLSKLHIERKHIYLPNVFKNITDIIFTTYDEEFLTYIKIYYNQHDRISDES